jgi:thioredoxin-dependent peroxiredoxin
MTSLLAIGMAAPLFSLPDSESRCVSLESLKGRVVVLYFYPKDCTPGCTWESQDFRDAYPVFEQLNTVILGISRDTITSHKRFKARQNLPFELLSDTEEVVCQQYGVIKPKSSYGRLFRRIERSTFLIDTRGILHAVWRGVKITGHVQGVLETVRLMMQSE